MIDKNIFLKNENKKKVDAITSIDEFCIHPFVG